MLLSFHFLVSLEIDQNKIISYNATRCVGKGEGVMKSFLLIVCLLIGQADASTFTSLDNEKEDSNCLNCSKAKEYYGEEDFKDAVISLEQGVLAECKSCQFLYGLLALSGAYMFKDTETGISLVIKSAVQKYQPATDFLNNLNPAILKENNIFKAIRFGTELLDKKYLLGGPEHYSFFIK